MSRAPLPEADDRKPDRRRDQTRKACLDAFIALLLTTDYDAISVNGVITHAKVGRSTFYDHFTGKEDLLRQCVANPFGLLADSLRDEADTAALAGVLAHFRAQRRLVRRLLSGETRALLVRSLAGLIEDRLGPGWPSGPARATPMRLASLSLAETQLGMVAHWLEQSAAESPPHAFAEVMSHACRAVAASFRGEPVRPQP